MEVHEEKKSTAMGQIIVIDLSLAKMVMRSISSGIPQKTY